MCRRVKEIQLSTRCFRCSVFPVCAQCTRKSEQLQSEFTKLKDRELGTHTHTYIYMCEWMSEWLGKNGWHDSIIISIIVHIIWRRRNGEVGIETFHQSWYQSIGAGRKCMKYGCDLIRQHLDVDCLFCDKTPNNSRKSNKTITTSAVAVAALFIYSFIDVDLCTFHGGSTVHTYIALLSWLLLLLLLSRYLRFTILNILRPIFLTLDITYSVSVILSVCFIGSINSTFMNCWRRREKAIQKMHKKSLHGSLN